MGRSYLFECPKCTYRATVSGGTDEGLDCSVQTVICRDCRRLFDVITRLRVIAPDEAPAEADAKTVLGDTPPDFDQVLHHLPLPSSKPFHWMEFPLRCPVSPVHDVERWTDPGKCPVCGAFLEKSGLPFRVWN